MDWYDDPIPGDVTAPAPTRPGYYDEITGEFIPTDGPGVVPGPLDDTSGTKELEGWKYQDGVWTDPAGKAYDLSYLNVKDKSALSRFISYAKKMFGGEGSTEDYMQLLPFLGGLFGANQGSGPTVLNPGYQGGIPQVTATRKMLTEPPAGRRPGSGGINYGGDVTYARTGENLSAENAGISTPVSQPLGGTPTYTQPAAYDLASLAALIRQLQQFQEQNRPTTPAPAPAPSPTPAPTPSTPSPSTPAPTPAPAPSPTPAPAPATPDAGFVTGGGGGGANYGGFSTKAEYDAAVAAKAAEDARRRAELEAYTPSAPFLAQYFADPSLIPRMHGESIEDAVLRLKAQDKDYTDRLARRTALQNQFAQANPEASAQFIVAPNATAAAPTPSPFTTGGGAPATTPTPGPSQVIADETGFTPPRDYASSTAQPVNDLQGLFQQVYGRQGADWEVQNLAGKSMDEARNIMESSIANWRAQNPTRAARGGLLPDGFVIPADVVSHFGNGSSEAGLELLAEELGAKPIKGDGDGMSDSIPTTIGGKQPARVANEEAFVPPDVVKKLGGGDTERGAKKLYAMMDRIRKARTGTTEQGKEINPEKFMPGGKVNRYAAGGTATGATAGGGLASQSLADWVGPYVADMLGKGQALSEMPYSAYTGPLTAGASPLQQQAFATASGLQTPAAIGQAAQTAGGLASTMSQLGYTPATFGNQFAAPGAYQPMGAPAYNPLAAQGVSSTFQAPQAYQTGTFTNQFTAPTGAYTPGTFDTEMFGTEQAQRYMNPYVQQVLNPQLREAQRQADINRASEAARMAKAGAYGGSRQAIMEAEGSRNLLNRMSDITGAGYASAYDKAQQAFTQDQARRLQAQQAAEGAKQFGAGQAMTAAQLAAQYGLSAEQAREASRQFGAQQGLTAATTSGAQALQAALANQQAGLTAGQANINAALEAARQQEASRQFGAGQGMTAAQLAAQYGLSGQQASEASRQFGATYGLQGLQSALQAAQAQGNLGIGQSAAEINNLRALAELGGVQRGIESEGIAADKAQFEEARLNPYKMLQFQQSLLSGLPLASQSLVQPGQSNLQQFAGGFSTIAQLLQSLGLLPKNTTNKP